MKGPQSSPEILLLLKAFRLPLFTVSFVLEIDMYQKSVFNWNF